MTATTEKQRRYNVEQMNANHAIEDFAPTDADRQLQEQYIEGKTTLADMLAHAQQFAEDARGK